MAGSPTRTAPGLRGRAIADSVRRRADEWLPVGAVASLLHIRVEDVLLLLVAGILPSRKRNEAPLVCRDSLENFAFSLALGLDDGESFEAGLIRFLGWIRRVVEDPELPRGSISARDARLLRAVLGPEEAFARQFTHLLVEELAEDLSREFESPERVTDRRTVTRRLQREARRDQAHRSRPSMAIPELDTPPEPPADAPPSSIRTHHSTAGERSPTEAAKLRTGGDRRREASGERPGSKDKRPEAPTRPTGGLSRLSEERLLTPLDMPSDEFEAWAETPRPGLMLPPAPTPVPDFPAPLPHGAPRPAAEARPDTDEVDMPVELEDLLDDDELDRFAAEPEPVAIDESVIQLDAKAEAAKQEIVFSNEQQFRVAPESSVLEDEALAEDDSDELSLYDSSESEVLDLMDIFDREGGSRSAAPPEPTRDIREPSPNDTGQYQAVSVEVVEPESGAYDGESFELMSEEETDELFDSAEDLDDLDEEEGEVDGFVASSRVVGRRFDAPPASPTADPFGGDPFASAATNDPFAGSSDDLFAGDPFGAGGGSPGMAAPPGGAVFGGFSASTSAPRDSSLTDSGYATPPMAPPPPPPAMPMPSMAPPPMEAARSAPVSRGAPGLSSMAASLGSNIMDRIKEAREEPQEPAELRRAPLAKMKKRASGRAKSGRVSRSRAPAPAKPKPVAAQAAPQRREVEIETVERRTTVRYYKQMYVQKNYPLLVIISQHKIKKLVSVLVNQVSSRKAFKIKTSNPIVHIRPIFPGCLCVPASLDLDVTERIAEAQFHLTPSATGPLDGARVEILYEGKVVDTIPVETVATTQAMAKLSGSLAFVTTTLGPAFKDLGEDLKQRGAEWIGEMLQLGGTDSGPLVTSTLLGLATFALYWWNRPQEAPPIENFFDYEAGQETPGDAHVIAQRARIVVLSRSNRQKYELVESETRLGRSSECQIVLSERSVKPTHCKLSFDGDTERFSIEALDGAVKVDGLEVDGDRELPREAVVELSQQCQLWFYNEREDADGFDRAEVRQRIETKLLETLGSFTGEIQSAFRNPQNKTVRAALAELMVKGVLTPSRWALIKRSAGDFA